MTNEVIGLMSGTSMDGVDLCHCELALAGGKWNYRIIRAETKPYPVEWRRRLDGAISLPPDGLADIDAAYAGYLGDLLQDFLGMEHRSPIVASHGHTIHHVPAKGYTRQIGDPQLIADRTGLTVVGDFRSGDVALGGQGAPLVPLADRLLFGEFAACVNLGGFANLSFERAGARIAGDVSVCNLLSDRLASELGYSFDRGGNLARRGEPDASLLWSLEGIPFFGAAMPKSLGREWLEREVWPLYADFLESSTQRDRAVLDALATAGHHLSRELAGVIAQGPAGRVLVTGGGAYNDYLLDGLRQNLPVGYHVERPDELLIDYKEALAFALLGVLRIRGEVNILSSVTGARRDSSGGVVCEPSKAGSRALAQA